jgi:hypothetical protein
MARTIMLHSLVPAGLSSLSEGVLNSWLLAVRFIAWLDGRSGRSASFGKQE